MNKMIHNFILLLSAVCGFAIIAGTSGINLFESFKYLCYCFCMFYYGWVIYLVLVKECGNFLRQLCLGWVLGYTLEGLVYLFRPFLGQAVTLYGTVLLGICLFPFAIRKLRDVTGKDGITNREIMAYILVSILTILVIRFCNISEVSLPSVEGGETYYQDLIWHLSLAGEAKWHNLPFQNPSVSGEPLRYYPLPYIHIATSSSVTGIELSKILLRLFPLELYFLWAMMLCWAGKELDGKFAGLITVSLVLLIGSLSGLFALNSARKMGLAPLYADDLFFNHIFWSAFQSPGFLMGIVLFVALIVLIAEVVRERGDYEIAKILMIMLLITASAFAKSVLMPILIMGVFGVLTWQSLVRHKLNKGAGVIFVLMCIVYIVTKGYTHSVYVNYVKFAPFKLLFDIDINSMVMYYAQKYSPGLLWLVKIALPPFVIFGYAPLPIFGLALFIIYCKRKFAGEEIWLMSLYLGSFSIAMLFALNGGEWGFLGYGSVPLAIMSTKGLVELFKSGPKSNKKLLLQFMVMVLFVSGLTTTIVKCMFPTINRHYYAKRYGSRPLLSPDLLKGLRWLRSNTASDVVIAVNFTQDLWKGKKTWYYSEFSERRNIFIIPLFPSEDFSGRTFPTPQFHQWANIYKEDAGHIPFLERRKL